MSMVDLTQSLLGDFEVVIFIEGTLKDPHSNLSASAIKALMETGLAFKAIDSTDEKYNPGVRAAVEELAGEHPLPQLFTAGKHLGNGYKIQELHDSGSLKATLQAAGAVEASSR